MKRLVLRWSLLTSSEPLKSSYNMLQLPILSLLSNIHTHFYSDGCYSGVFSRVNPMSKYI